jgi:hypothetical protein
VREPEALILPVRDDYKIYATGIKRARDGKTTADVTLLLGKRPLYSNIATLNTVDGRNAWVVSAVTEAAGPNPPTANELNHALLGSVIESAETLQSQAVASQAKTLVELILKSGAELFHDPNGLTWARADTGTHREVFALGSKSWRRFMAGTFYRNTESPPSAAALSDADNVLQSKALFDGQQIQVHTRIAEHEGSIYIDLCDEDWRAVQIDANGWRIVSDSPICFRRAGGMRPLPLPTRGGSLTRLRDFVNLQDDDAWRLYVSALIQAMRPTGPYPILVFHGRQGSAKTTACRVFRYLVDDNGASLRAEPRDTRDLMIAATNGWVVAYDNLSRVHAWLSDSLCRLSTGGGLGTRELFTDNGESLFEAQRPVLLNGIEEIATRADLLDRSIILYLESVPTEKRRPEGEFWSEFEREAPAILGTLLDAVSAGLRNLPNTHVPGLPRMADFALWACAVGPACGWSQDEFLDAYTANRNDANELTLEASPITAPLRAMVGKWSEEAESSQYTAATLLAELELEADESTQHQSSWPKNARALSQVLRRLQTNFEAIGIGLELPKGSGRTITVTRKDS